MTEKVRRSELDLSMAYQIPQGGNLETRPVLKEANFCAIHRESPDQATIAKIALRGAAVGVLTPLTVYDAISQNPA